MNQKETEDQLRQLAAAGAGHSSHFLARLRGYFLTGLIVVGPIAITIYVVWWFINLVDNWVKPLIPQDYLPETYLPVNIPGVGLIVGILGLMFIGALMANLFGRTLFSYGEILLDRMPVVRGVYRLLKQIFQSIFADTGHSFKKVGLIEFPRQGVYAVAFISGETPSEVKEKAGDKDDEIITVFMPNAPNPTTGFVMFMPAKDVQILDMTVEEGVKLVLSAGLVSPDKERSIAELQKDVAPRKRRGRKESIEAPVEPPSDVPVQKEPMS
ncbi:hypothetical protein A7A08_00471 [Methyloligella halotolerans]|uniref:DUF502 domain-containing protein n=1 Tax=Methyloligella halotolerans TaxID=1177755 RepID=A0A1E2S2M7_9HYPH|nr:DUF502 domain-containing protein [Methyloligella halotolerans]ODA68640.1 hypothetical protein A7A08_00471 [Methyloligella halotolerans]